MVSVDGVIFLVIIVTLYDFPSIPVERGGGWDVLSSIFIPCLGRMIQEGFEFITRLVHIRLPLALG